MKCENIREQLMEVLLSGPDAAAPEVREHLRNCATCARGAGFIQADHGAAG